MLRFRKFNNKSGFSFIEIFISLIVLSLMLATMSTVNQTYHRVNGQIREERKADFLHFLTLLEKEINKYYVKNVAGNRVVIKDPSKPNNQYVILQNSKIYITPGHQPLLYEVKDWYLTLVDQRLYIVIVFTNGDSEHGSVEISLYEDSIYGR